MKNIRQKITKIIPTDFSGADDMGDELSNSSEESAITQKPPDNRIK